jgi:hypothetical protein
MTKMDMFYEPEGAVKKGTTLASQKKKRVQ